MRILTILFILSVTTSANGSWFSSTKSSADKDGNCLPEVINENARLYSELQNLDKIAARSEAQAKNSVKETQKLGLAGFKELSEKAKSTRTAIQKFGSTYGSTSCKAMLKGKVSTLVIKDIAASHEKFAVEYEKMAEDWLRPSVSKNK